MPQLDKITFISQISWFFLLCFYFYIFLIFIKLVDFVNIKKLKLNDLVATILLWLNLTTVIYTIHFYKKVILLKI